MPLDFPTSPADGDTYEQYKWSAADGVWQLNNPVVVEPDPTYSIEYLVIAGGGAGGANGSGGGGGGGAGGYLTGSTTLTDGLNSTFTVTVGAGGAGASGTPGTNGSKSLFSTVRAVGGGGGASAYWSSNAIAYGFPGGSAGGHGHWNFSGTVNGTPTVDSDQGYASGSLQASGGERWGSSGGGAGQVGGSANTSVVNPGGNGLASSITGTSVTRAGGGGGGPRYVSTTAGGAGGGGTGSWGGTPTAGQVNTGSGGGGASGSSAAGGAGGSGIVILKYPDTAALTIGAGLTSSTTTVTGYKITTFTAGTGTVTIGPA